MSSVRKKCKRWALFLLLVLFLFDAALIVAFLVKQGKDDSPAPAPVPATAVPLDPEKKLAKVDVTLCLEWVPGQGKSEMCLPEATSLGGHVANLVADAIRQQTGADIALISAGTTQDDIPAGTFTVRDAKNVLGRDFLHPLIQLQVTGEQIEIVLEQAIFSSLDDFRPNHYPYAAGMRFDVNGGGSLNDRLLAGSMVSNVEVNIQDEWAPLDAAQMYTLATTKLMADGGDGYLEFANVERDSRQALDLDLGTALMDYAETVKVLEEPNSSTKSFVNQLVNRRLTTVLQNICLEWVPGQGKSEICSGEEYTEHAGGACNLVAISMLVQAGSEVAILNAGECRSDIWQGGFWVEDAQTLLRTNLQLVILNITGSAMVRALEGAVDSALGGSNSQGSYPYAGGLRYTVDSTAGMGSRLSHVEWFAEGKTWSELSPQRYYQLVTTLYLAHGNDGYDEFEKVPYKETNMKLQSVFIEYAETWEFISDPPRDKDSTQHFIST
jgi:2',3'-cyclic-nucleotide 2'-phosphodiesterase (5'-nucleotidase family)